MRVEFSTKQGNCLTEGLETTNSSSLEATENNEPKSAPPQDIKDDKMIIKLEYEFNELKSDVKKFEIQLKTVNDRPEHTADPAHYTVDLSEIKEELEKELSAIMDRLNLLESKQEQMYSMTQNKIAKFAEKFEKSTSGATRNLSTDSAGDSDSGISKKALEEINRSIQEKIDELNEKLEQKADLDDTMKELNSFRDAITSLNLKKHVDPAAHAKQIAELEEKIDELATYEKDIEILTTKNEDLSKQLQTSEESIDKILHAMAEKASNRDVSDLFSRLKAASGKMEKFVNHLNEIQKQIDMSKSESGPDFLRMINTIEKRVETVQEVFNERMFETEKDFTKLEEEVTEFKKLADKSDISLIKLIQQVDSMQSKLDLLDQAFNGFMVPSGLLHGSQDSGMVDYIKDSVTSLRREFFKFKDESGANFTLIGETLSKNADKHDLKDLENKLTEKIDLNEKLNLKSKTEMRRIIKDLEEKVR